MTLLRRKRVLAAKIETTVGTAISLAAADGTFNAYNPIIQPNIPFEERESQGGFAYRASVPGGLAGTATFRTDFAWSGAGYPAYFSTLLPACGWVDFGGYFKPLTEAPGSNVKTLTIGCYVDGVFKSIKGACGTFQMVFPTGRMAYIDWTFTGVWVNNPTDASILDPTLDTLAIPLRAAGAATTFNSITLCNENVTIDAGNTVVLRECATGTSGYHAAIITNRKPIITCNPEAKLVATRPTYTDWLNRVEALFAFTIPSATGDGVIEVTAPKAQLINVQEGERNGIVTDELEFQCNKNGNTEDEELTITLTDDA